jgi:hypothetical protein
MAGETGITGRIVGTTNTVVGNATTGFGRLGTLLTPPIGGASTDGSAKGAADTATVCTLCATCWTSWAAGA